MDLVHFARGHLLLLRKANKYILRDIFRVVRCA